MRACSVCGGSGYTLESSVKVTNPVSFVLMVAEALIPFAGRRAPCWKCRGKKFYQPVKTNYRSR